MQREDTDHVNNEDQFWARFEHSGQLKHPLDLHLVHPMDLIFDQEMLSTGIILNAPPSLINPNPLHPEHAIIFRSPHLLHIPRELHIQGVAHEWRVYLARKGISSNPLFVAIR